jgi:hypothetical protein
MNTEFKLQFTDTGDQKTNLAAYAYDVRNRQIAFAPIVKGAFSLPFDKAALRKVRILVAPIVDADSKEMPINQVLRLSPFEVSVPRLSGKVIDLGRVPDNLSAIWKFCVCRIKGRVLNSRCENPNIPVEGARVHICEVDSIFNLIVQAPDWKIINLRDWIIQQVEIPRFPKIPPIITWPPIGPDPSPIEDLLRGKVTISQKQLDKRAVVFNPTEMKQTDMAQKALSETASFVQRAYFSGEKLSFASEKSSFNKILDATNSQMFFANDAGTIRKYFLEFHPIIFPNFCQILSWFYRYDEIGTAITDSNGNFSYLHFYNCKDQPDVYIWIEYPVDGGWATVYRPSVGCNTIWNYQCGSDITIHVNNPLVPCVDEPNVQVPAKSVAVLSIGEWANVAHIAQGASNTGIPNAGVFANNPFAGTMDPRVYFDKALALDVNNPGGLNYFYRWSYRREGATDWLIMSAPVTRHYEDFIPPNPVPVFPTLQLGPDTDMLYRIVRFYTPDGQPIFTQSHW